MNSLAQWYVVYTRPRWEKKVADILTRKGLEVYCPLNKVLRQWHDRKKMVIMPLFTSYVFVKAEVTQLYDIKEENGVINLVYWLGKPAIVRSAEIDAIKNFLIEYQNVQLEKVEVNPNDMVRIVNGPLMNREGSVKEVLHHSVKVLLPSLGYALVAEVSKSSIILVRRENDAKGTSQWLKG